MDPDDVLTKEEQIYLLVEAREKCQRDIRAQLEKVKGTAWSCTWVGLGEQAVSPLMAAGHVGDTQFSGTAGSRCGFVRLLAPWLLCVISC